MNRLDLPANPKSWATLAGLLAAGAAGGIAAHLLGMPMPYLLGSLVTVGAIALALAGAGLQQKVPQPMRRAFIACIGAMIGSTFSRDLIGLIPSLWVSMLAMVLFVGIAHFAGFLIFHRVAGYDRTTAVYAALPGGLIEAVTLGEQAGGDARVLSVQHFARIVLVVMIVPTLFYLWSGETVGSAAGQALAPEPATWGDILVLLSLAGAGMWLGPYLRLPAAHMMGPLVLSAVVHGAGLVDTNGPAWLLALSQLVVGTALGTTFAGSTLGQLGVAFGFGAVSVIVMLTLGLGFAFALAPLVPLDVQTLFISFAPGGVTEMGLIALSLGISPVIVSIHHLFRIILAATIAGRIK